MGEVVGEIKELSPFDVDKKKYEKALYDLRDAIAANDIVKIKDIAFVLSEIESQYPELSPERDLVTERDH